MARRRCCCTNSPCFCTGQFSQFQVVFSSVADNGLCLSQADSWNGTHTIDKDTVTSSECSGTDDIGSYAGTAKRLLYTETGTPPVSSCSCSSVLGIDRSMDLTASVAYIDGVDILLTVLAEWKESTLISGFYTHYDCSATFSKTIPIDNCTDIAETLTFQSQSSGICSGPGSFPDGSGTWDFSTATCTLSLLA